MSTINMTARLSKKYIMPGQESRLYLMVELTSKEKDEAAARLPLNIGFVLDRSGSMGGEKLAYTKQALSCAVNHFSARDYASLTVYDNEVDVLIGSQTVSNKDNFKSVVNQIFCGGCTNLSGGLIKGYREVMKKYAPDQLNRVLLLTDGLANQGVTDKGKLCAKAAAMKKSGVSVTTLGVGEDFDEDLLTAMAEASGGNYYFIDSTDRIPQVFVQEMQSLLNVVAQNVTLCFEQSEHSLVTKVWGYRPRGDRRLTMDLPDLLSSDRKVIVMEITAASADEGPMPLGSLSVAYDDAVKDLELVSVTCDMHVAVTRDEGLLGEVEDGEVMLNVELNRAAELREEAIRLADAGDVDGAANLMTAQRNTLFGLDEDAAVGYASELQAEIENIDAAISSLNGRQYDALARKKMAFASYRRRRNQKK